MSWWFVREAPYIRRPRAEAGAGLTAGSSVPDGFSLADFEATLDLEEERKASRRTETWLFLRALLILVFVIGVVLLRQAALV